MRAHSPEAKLGQGDAEGGNDTDAQDRRMRFHVCAHRESWA